MDLIIKDMPSFSVIGKLGSTEDGEDFIPALWADANAHFGEIAHLAAKNEDGSLLGCFGAMSDFSLSFLPWEDGFSRGLYLAGVACIPDAVPPDGWVKWTLPGFRYACVKITEGVDFRTALQAVLDAGYSLCGAVQDFTDPASGENDMYFPIARL
ncbi:MAG: GyrI-like domain-containing protein [Clostridia bacterium]|nr:GyrI-like domain-containing protein [Clostridia bacterium]